MANRALFVGSALALTLACARPRVADPRAAVAVYSEAARQGDVEAIYGMLSRRSQRELGREGVRRLVADARAELATQADALGKPNVPIEAVAVVRYDDGEQAVLELEDGTFTVGSAAALPSAPRTPAQALGDLRQALARRSYAAFVRVLSAESRSALESDVSALVRGLEDPETLEIDVRGEGAEVELPGGHVVKLKRERGVWRVEDLR
ncbi:MAG TPA: hypothetical protein VIM73_08835 [Polyangiaceae bacterium]